MRKIILFLSCILSFYAGIVSAKDYYVSLEGDDANPGTMAKPFATPEKARDTIRELKKSGGLPSGGITVWLRGGVYYRSTTFILNSSDSGTEEAPITYAAYPDETVHLMGGRFINNFSPVTDETILARFKEDARGHILQANLADLGMTSFPGINQQNGPGIELYYQSELMTLARYPNEGWLTIQNVPINCENPFVGDPRTLTDLGTSAGMHCGYFLYTNPMLAKQYQLSLPVWEATGNIWMYGYWYWDWSSMYQKVDHIDYDKKAVWFSPPYHYYGYRGSQWYYFLNIMEELDSPGEWYIDDKNSILYFWPSGSISENYVFISSMNKALVNLSNVSYTTIKGIVLQGTRSTAIVMSGTHNTIDGCEIMNVSGDYAVSVDGEDNGAVNCHIHDIGGGGISIGGGDRKTLTPAGNYAINNHIHHFQKTATKWVNGIDLSGVGNRMAHNYIHDSPASGSAYLGNEHVIEYNEITRVAQETGDVKAIGTGADWTYAGIIIRYNYIHDIHGPGYGGCTAIYLDLPGSGAYIYGNVILNVDEGFLTNSGRNNIIENNIFVDCHPSVNINRMEDPGLYVEGESWNLYGKYYDMVYEGSPYLERYPWLANIYDDPSMPLGNVVTRNISYGGEFIMMYNPKVTLDIVSVSNNLITDPVIFQGYYNNTYNAYTQKDMKVVDALEKDYGNIVTNDPGFIDLENRDFRLRDDSPAWSLGFEPIPFDKIGLLDEPVHTYAKEEQPSEYKLYQNSPNPFNPLTAITFSIPKNGQVKLTVFNLLGQEVARLADNLMTAGLHRVVFDGSNLASGVYIYRLEYGNVVKTRKMLLVK